MNTQFVSFYFGGSWFSGTFSVCIQNGIGGYSSRSCLTTTSSSCYSSKTVLIFMMLDRYRFGCGGNVQIVKAGSTPLVVVEWANLISMCFSSSIWPPNSFLKTLYGGNLLLIWMDLSILSSLNRFIRSNNSFCSVVIFSVVNYLLNWNSFNSSSR